jgi:hypothetical protein
VQGFASTSHESSGKFRIFSRTNHDGSEGKRDTVVLWSDGTIQQDEELDSMVVARGKVKFSGKVKDLVILGGEVILEDGSKVDGSLVVLGGKLIKKEGAKVSEQVQFELPGSMPKWILALGPFFAFIYSDSAQFLFVIVRAVIVCLLGALLYVIMPKLMHEAEFFATKSPAKSAMWSVVGMLLFVPGLVMLAISIIGIFFIPLFLMAYGFVYLFSAFVMAANILGNFLPPRDSAVMPPLRFFYGVFIFVLISQIPWVGTMFIYSCMAITAGAMFRMLVGRFRNRGAEIPS